MKNRFALLIFLGSLLIFFSGCTPKSNSIDIELIMPDNLSVNNQQTNSNIPIDIEISEIQTTKEIITMILTSAAFEEGQPIPPRFACHGDNISPALSWTNVPENVESFVLVMDDPDAIPVAGYVWDHWLIYNLPKEVLALGENISSDEQFADGSTQGMTSFNRVGYGGPCPPAGQVHAYIFTLYALDTQLNLPPSINKVELLALISENVISQAVLTGTYPEK
jgi:Raf kinase inhibitor-like YbhB/YbcL family protein